jgi:hypothetical protein
MYLFGINPFLGVFEGVGPEISTFWAQMALATLVPISGPKKVLISGPTPSNAPRYGLLPHPNPYVPPHINNRYIGNFMDKRKETRDFRAHSEMAYNKRVRSLRGE